MDTPILTANNLSIGYSSKSGDKVIAKGINFEINKKELVGIIGANGIGKSTLIKTLAGNHLPLGGNIRIKSNPLNSYDPTELSKVLSLVLTEQIVSKNLSVFELVSLGRQPYTNWLDQLREADLNIINEALARTDLMTLKDNKCYELSDGQLQKAMIARAISQNTSLIIMDEPTTHLDIYYKAYILKLLRNLVDITDKTIVFATHEIELAIQMCDRLIVMIENGFYFDTPKNLIEEGVFGRLFPSDLIEFNQANASFRIIN